MTLLLLVVVCLGIYLTGGGLGALCVLLAGVLIGSRLK